MTNYRNMVHGHVGYVGYAPAYDEMGRVGRVGRVGAMMGPAPDGPHSPPGRVQPHPMPTPPVYYRGDGICLPAVPAHPLPQDCYYPAYPGFPPAYPSAYPWGYAARPGEYHIDVSQYGRPVAPRREPIDAYDATFQGALRERGQGLGEADMARLEVQLIVGNVFNLVAQAPLPFTLASMTCNANAATFLTGVRLEIGGQPIGSYAGSIDLNRFQFGSFDKRLPAIQVPAGTPISVTGTVRAGAPAAPDNFYLVSIQGLPIKQSLEQAAA